MTREEFWMQIYLKDLGSNKESFHADKALAEFYDRFPVKRESSNEDSSEDNPSEWIDWSVGDCPVPPETIVEVILRCGGNPERGYAKSFRWDALFYDNPARLGEGDIIKYRVVKE